MKALLIGYYGASNIGDDILCEGAYGLISDTATSVYILTHDSAYIRTQYPQAIPIYARDYTSIMKAILQSDYIIFGGGSIFQDISSIKSLLYYFCIVLFAFITSKKVIMLAQGIGPFVWEGAEMLASQAYTMAHAVSIREGQTNAQYMQKWGINYTSVADLIWGLPDMVSESVPDTIVISLRADDHMTIADMQALAQHISLHYAMQHVTLLGMQTADIKVLMSFANMLTNIKAEIIKPQNAQELMKIFARAKESYAMRLHAVYASIMCHVPTTALSYDPKVQNLATLATIPAVSVSDMASNGIPMPVAPNEVYITAMRQLYLQNAKFIQANIQA